MVKDWKHSEWGYRGTTEAGIVCEICRWRKSRDGFSCNSILHRLGHIVYMKIHRKYLRGVWRKIVAECPCCGATEMVNKSSRYAGAETILDKAIPLNIEFAKKMRRLYGGSTSFNAVQQEYMELILKGI